MIGGKDLHDDMDSRQVSILTDDERPLLPMTASTKQRMVRMRRMVETFLLPFSYGYMTNAMWVSALVGGVCAFLSAYLMLKGWSLIGDALSHSIVPGVALTYMLGLPFVTGIFFGWARCRCNAFSQTANGVKGRRGHRVDLQLLFLGLFMVSLSPTSVDVNTITLAAFWRLPLMTHCN